MLNIMEEAGKGGLSQSDWDERARAIGIGKEAARVGNYGR